MKTKEKILSLHGELKTASSLRPSPHINRVFTELVGLSSSASDLTSQKVLGDREIQQVIPDLRLFSSTGECELERHWTSKILRDPHPSIALEQFPYYENYLKLTELEFHSLRLVGSRPIKRVLFIGSGPLPLSSILMAQQYGLSVDNIDNDNAAVRLSTQLVKSLGLGDVVNIERAEALDYVKYGEYDAIFLAALVGLEASAKQRIITKVCAGMKAGSLLIVRTAHNLRTLLYPAVDIDSIKGLKPLVTIQPLNEIVNSVSILEKSHQTLNDELVVEDKTNPETALRFRQFCFNMINNVYRYPYNSTWHFDIDRAEEIYGGVKSNLFVVRHKGEVLATAAIRPYDRDYAMFKGRYDSNTGSIWRFFINPEYRQLNLDRLLHEHLERFARKSGFEKLYAHDQRDVPGAMGKYIRHGYEVTYESTDSFSTVHFEKDLEDHA